MGQVTPLLKKNDEFRKENYRPVTVLPALNNIYERLLVPQLGDFYQSILSDFISSYRKFHSCETALLKLTKDWWAMLDKGELVTVVSMDLSKAFDVIDHDLLLAKLKAHGVGERSRFCALQGLFIGETAEGQDWGHVFQLERCYKRGAARKCPGASVFQYFQQRLVLLDNTM